MWINKEEISGWAYFQCQKGNDIEEIRNLITEDDWLVMYCTNIKFRKEIWDKISRERITELQRQTIVRNWIQAGERLLNVDN